MAVVDERKVESPHLKDFEKIMSPDGFRRNRTEGNLEQGAARIDLNQEDLKNGLGQLVLTLVKLLHELLERQAIHRIDEGSLTDDEIENIGLALMQQSEEIDRMRREFNLEEADLNLDLGPLGRLL